MRQAGAGTRGSVEVELPADLQALVPGSLANRRGDHERICALLAAGDLAGIARIGHRMKGNGASYGFARLSVLGAALEAAASDADAARVGALAVELDDYLTRLRVRYA